MTSVQGVSTGPQVQDVIGGRHGLRSGVAGPVLISVVVTAVGAILWVTVFPRVGTDLSAQIARAEWASRYPGSAYLFNWYGGIYPASYALLTPYLLAVAGVRLGTAVAAIIAAGLLALLLARHQVPRPRTAAAWAGVAMCTQFTAGRSAFTLGLAAGLGCLTALAVRQAWLRLLVVGLLALLTSALSPVAGLFLGLAAVVLLLTTRRIDGLVIGVGAALPIGLMTALFRDGGVQPIGYQNAVPALLSAAGVLVFVPRRWRMVRLGALVYAVVVITVWTVPTPLGSNVERLGELLIGPLLAGLAGLRPPWSAQRIPVALALAAAATWQLIQPITDLSHGNGPMYVPQTAALVSELGTLHADTARVEAVPQYGHWESQQLAGVVWLARGWERQVDVRRNPLFYGGTLTPAAYYGWLRSNAVRYVAISATIPDFAATAEADVIRLGEPWLVPVWRDSFWTLYRVAGAMPLASPPATVTATTPAQITVRFSRAGTTIVRVRWSPWLRASGSAAVSQHGEWTSLTVRHPGNYTMSAPY